MCTSSTATPAGDRTARPRAVRKQSSGRSRLPPAASASPATSCASPGRARDRAREPRLDLGHVRRRRPASRAPARAGHARDPRVQRDDRAAEQAEPDLAEAGRASSCDERSRRRGSASPTRAGRCRRRRPAAPCRAAGTMRSNHSEKNGRSGAARLGDLEDREPPAGPQDAPQLAQTRARGRRRCARRSRRSRRRTCRRANGSASRSPCTHSIAAPLRAGALEHRSREVEAGHLCRTRLQVGDREVAGAAAASSTRRRGARRLARRGGASAGRARGHHAVHHVVDRRDPVEHRADGVGRERHDGWPQRGDQASCRGRAGRACGRRRSRPGRRRSRRRGRSRARGRGSSRRPGAA